MSDTIDFSQDKNIIKLPQAEPWDPNRNSGTIKDYAAVSRIEYKRKGFGWFLVASIGTLAVVGSLKFGPKNEKPDQPQYLPNKVIRQLDFVPESGLVLKGAETVWSAARTIVGEEGDPRSLVKRIEDQRQAAGFDRNRVNHERESGGVYLGDPEAFTDIISEEQMKEIDPRIEISHSSES